MVLPFNSNGRVKPDLALTCAAPIVTTLGCCCYLRREYLGAGTLWLFTRRLYSRICRQKRFSVSNRKFRNRKVKYSDVQSYSIYTITLLTATSRFSRDLATCLAHVTMHELVRLKNIIAETRYSSHLISIWIESNASRLLRMLKCVFLRVDILGP